MADRDIETVVDAMEPTLPCGCGPDHQCPEHETRPEPR